MLTLTPSLTLTPTLSLTLTLTLSLTLNPNPANPKLQVRILPFALYWSGFVACHDALVHSVEALL